MVSKYSAFLLLLVLSTAYSKPVGEEVKEDVTSPAAQSAKEPVESNAENADPSQTDDEKLLFPVFSLTANMKPNPPPPPPPPPQVQTLLVPQGTQVSIQGGQQVTVQQQPQTIISTQQAGGPTLISTQG